MRILDIKRRVHCAVTTTVELIPWWLVKKQQEMLPNEKNKTQEKVSKMKARYQPIWIGLLYIFPCSMLIYSIPNGIVSNKLI